MVRKRLKRFYGKEALEFLNQVMQDKPLLPFLIPLGLFAWAVERWLVPFSNWVPLAAAVWATIEPTTPLEPCQWLNKLLIEVWPNFMEPKLSKKFFSIVERRLKNRRPKLIEKIELQDFSLGSCPPDLGRQGIRWVTSGDQQVMQLGFDWDTNEMSVMFLAKLAKPLIGAARIVINSIHIKGDLLLIPILDGQALLYSFESTPEVRVGVAFGSGGSDTLPATELPGVSTWLVKLFTETLNKTMVEPRRQCFPLPPVDLRKKAVGGVISVTVISASNVGRNTIKSNNSESPQRSMLGSSKVNGSFRNKVLQTFIEVEIGDLMRKTSISAGSDPIWNSTFNMVLHGDSGVVRFHLYECDSTSIKYNYITSCEIKLKYVLDDSTIFWAIGNGSGVIAKHAEDCGKEVGIVVPFEDSNFGELTVSLVLKEWQFSDGSISLGNSVISRSQPSFYGSPNLQLRTGRKLKVAVAEGRNLFVKEKSGKCDPYVKLQYGKTLYRTKALSHTLFPVWNQKFEFDEIAGGEYLMIKCLSSEIFGDENIGSARVNLEGISEDSCRDVWVPLEKVSSGEIRLQIEAVKNEDNEGPKNSATSYGSGWIELVLIEARDLVAADLRGTSDPYVRVQYGNTKKRTKVVHKTLNPHWNQTLEFPDTGKPLVLYVKDHNAVLPTSSIGHCTVEYQGLAPNQTADKWIPLQGVRSGEIHVQVTRKIPELEKKITIETDSSPLTKGHMVSVQMRDLLKKLGGFVEDGDLEGLSLALSEVETVEDAQEEYILQLEREKALLLSKVSELDHEISRTSSSPANILF
ncbi:Synaptotagmin-5 [Ananas comosus]|uniref:Synaptotagmin-5 n=1 Tax=Ananas comosus TaxID=4615 RepID=A0A199UQR0_ANACO|nr:Synaptotagmin-5 [Ananas comosus]